MAITIPTNIAGAPDTPGAAAAKRAEQARTLAGRKLEEAHQAMIEACTALDAAGEHMALHRTRLSILSCDDARSELVR